METSTFFSSIIFNSAWRLYKKITTFIVLRIYTTKRNTMPEHAVEYYTKREAEKQASRRGLVFHSWELLLDHPLLTDRSCMQYNLRFLRIYRSHIKDSLNILSYFIGYINKPPPSFKGHIWSTSAPPSLSLSLSPSLSVCVCVCVCLCVCFISEDAKTRRSRFLLLHTQRQLISRASHSFICVSCARRRSDKRFAENLFRIAETSRRSIRKRRLWGA